MGEKKLIDATALCRYLSNWQLSCAGNVTGEKNARDNLVIYNTLDKVMEVIEKAPAEEQRVYNVRVDKDKLDAMQKVLTQQISLISKQEPEPVETLRWSKGNNIKCDERHFVIAEYVDDFGNADMGFAYFFGEEDYRANYNSESRNELFDRVGWYVLDPTCGRPMWNIKRWVAVPNPEEENYETD